MCQETGGAAHSSSASLSAALHHRYSTAASGETIHVASLGALAWRQDDFAKLVGVLASRRGVLIAYHEVERTFDLTRAEDRQAAIDAFPEARQRGSRQKGRIIGARVSAERRLAASKAGADRVRDRWGKPGEVQYKLVEETGVTLNTVVKQLGLWRIAKARWKRRLAAQEKQQ